MEILSGKERIGLYCTLGTEKVTRGSMGNTIRHERGANSFVDALFPMNEINSTRHLYPQVVLRMQKDVEIGKSGRIERRRSTFLGPGISRCKCRVMFILRTVNRGTIYAGPSTRRAQRLHHGIAR
jgi:hypothetical protein